MNDNNELLEEIKFLREKLEQYEEIKIVREKEKSELRKNLRALRTLSSCNQALVRAQDENVFINEVCNILTDVGAYKFAWVGYLQDDENQMVLPVAQSGFENGYLDNINISLADKIRGRGPVGSSIILRQPVIIKDTFSDQSFSPWKEDAIKRGYHSVISLPLIFNDTCYGVIAIYSDTVNYFDDAEVELLSELAKDMAYGITFLRSEIERELFEKELKHSEENYRKLVEISPNAVGVHVDGKLIYINKAGADILGAQSPEELIGTNVLSVVHPDYKNEVQKRIIRMSDGETLPAVEEKFLRLDGKVIEVMVAASPVVYNGKNAIQVVINDISGLKKAENILRESEERFRSIFENAPLGMYRTSLDGKILMANNAFINMLGYGSYDELADINIKQIYADKNFREKYIEKIKETGHAIGYETELLKKDGSRLFIRFNARYIKSLSDDNYVLEGTIEDISSKKKIEAELITAKQKAEEMNRIKSSFLANMSHELRTPLVAILGFAEIFQTELTDQIQLEMADSIYVSGQRLLETLNSILDFSRIESNKIEINKEKINIAALVKEDVSLFDSFARKKGLTIKAEIKDENAEGLLDRQMVHKILNNLINNAIKYTLNGGVVVSVDTIEEEEECWVKISVKDSGIGIAQKSLKIIFEEFRQVSEGLGRNFEGSGLGLTITKKFVEILEGTISVNSEVNKGTEFIVTLPSSKQVIKNAAIQSAGELTTKPANNGHEYLPAVLLVENDLPTIDVTKIILRKAFNVDVELTGLEAIRAAGRKSYDAILMDINLGAGMNGTEAMKNIRELPGYKDKAIVAFTAYAMMGDRERFLKEGFSDYIAKPFEKKTLLELMNKIFHKK